MHYTDTINKRDQATIATSTKLLSRKLIMIRDFVINSKSASNVVRECEYFEINCTN